MTHVEEMLVFFLIFYENNIHTQLSFSNEKMVFKYVFI